MIADAELLRRFVTERSEAAFREFVAQQIDFVYATALRHVTGDTHLAEEVAQTVFLDVARKARVLSARTSLKGWLYTSTRFAAARAVRARARRSTHETEAHLMKEILSASSSTDIDWNELRPVLDAALAELGDKDREAILLRFFEGRSLADVGAAIGLAENSARMRVDRALERLRTRLARRGITSSAAALAALLLRQPAVAAPAGLAAKVAGTSLAGAAVLSSGGAALALGFLEFMNATKIFVGTLGLVAAFGLGTYFGIRQPAPPETAPSSTNLSSSESALAALRDENRRLTVELARRNAELANAAPAPANATAGLAAGQPIPAGQWRVLAELKNRRLADSRVEFVKPNGTLSDAFANLFELSPTERESLQEAVTQAAQRLADLEAENAAVTRDDKGQVVITVKPFAPAGGVLYDAVMNSFAQTLGSERNAAFLALGADQVENAMGRFGAAQRTVTFAYDPQKTKSPYSVRDEVRAPGWGSSSSSSDYKTLQEGIAHVGTIAKLLPPEFGVAPK